MTLGTTRPVSALSVSQKLILTLLPATIISLLDQSQFFATAREYVSLRICHVTWNGSVDSRSPLFLQWILWYEIFLWRQFWVLSLNFWQSIIIPHASPAVLVSDVSLTGDKEMPSVLDGERCWGSCLWTITGPVFGEGFSCVVEISDLPRTGSHKLPWQFGIHLLWSLHIAVGYLRCSKVYFFSKMSYFSK